MEKRRIRLEINGVVCGLITQESEEYMQSLAGEVGEMMKEILAASPFVTREAAALTAALSYCDDAKKNGKRADDLQERADELEVEAELWQEEKAELEKNAPSSQAEDELREKIERLERENTALEETAQKLQMLEQRAALLEDENRALREELDHAAALKASNPVPDLVEERGADGSLSAGQEQPKTGKRRKNPLRYEEEFQQEGLISFFEKT